MCIFSGDVEKVYGTHIYARCEGNKQFLVYQMSLSMESETALILPIPVVPGCAEDALQFIDMSGYHDFFIDMARAFVMPTLSDDLAESADFGELSAEAPLVVHDVGAFDASFVPSVADFSRLDSRFQLPVEVWEELPQYADYGFAVFKLKPVTQMEVHPMAFHFPTRAPEELYFPTYHVHHRATERWSNFDHELYYQGTPAPNADWQTSNSVLGKFLDKKRLPKEKSQGIVDPQRYAAKRVMRGRYENRDTWLSLEH